MNRAATRIVMVLSYFICQGFAAAQPAPATRIASVLDFTQNLQTVGDTVAPEALSLPSVENSSLDMMLLPPDETRLRSGANPYISSQLRSDFALREYQRFPYVTQMPDTRRSYVGCLQSPYRPAYFLSRQTEVRRQALYPMIVQSACRYRLSVALLDALVIQESRYQVDALSPVKAYGLAQLMPSTARDLGVNRYSVWGNLDGGARYLRTQLDRFLSPHLALAAYNAGPSRVARLRAVPNIPETQDYVRQVTRMWRMLTHVSVEPTVAIPFAKNENAKNQEQNKAQQGSVSNIRVVTLSEYRR